MNKKLLIGSGVLIGVSLIIAIIAIVAFPGEPPGQVEPTPPKTELTPAEQDYAATMVEQSVTVGRALTELGRLLKSPNYGTEEWVVQTATLVATIWTACDRAMELEPPESMAHIHDKYVEAMQHFNTMTELLAHGIDESDPDLLDEAIVEMETGSQLIGEATKLMKEFTEGHS